MKFTAKKPTGEKYFRKKRRVYIKKMVVSAVGVMLYAFEQTLQTSSFIALRAQMTRLFAL
jgi:hypothetical protein